MTDLSGNAINWGLGEKNALMIFLFLRIKPIPLFHTSWIISSALQCEETGLCLLLAGIPN